GTGPSRSDEGEHLVCNLTRSRPEVEFERWSRGREEAKGAFHMRLVLWALHSGPHPKGCAQRNVDLWSMVRGLVVEQLGERSCPRRLDAVPKGLDDRNGVLVVANRDADESSRESVTLQLEVELQDFVIDGDGHAHAISDPLCAREEGLKRTAERQLVGASPSSSLGLAQAL